MNEQVLLEKTLGLLKAGGAEGDAYLVERRTLELRVREDELETLSRADVRGLAVRAMRDGRLGFVHTSAVDEDGVQRAAEKALALARAGSPRDDLVLPDPAGPGDGRDEGAALGIHDAAIEEHTIEEKKERARAADAAARAADPKIRPGDGGGYEENVTAHWIANTRGLFRHARRSQVAASASVIAEEAGDMQPGEYFVEATRYSDLLAPEELGRRAADRALRLLGGRPVPTGRYPVVVSPDVGWTLLLRLAVALSGEHLSRKRSWLADRGDQPLGSALVTVHDNARMPGGLATTPFDAEGVDTRDVTLLAAGAVRGQLTDLASAKRLGIPSNGNARRDGYEGLPEIRSSNLYLAPGTSKREEILASVDRGFWVWGLSGWWIGMEPANPTFSSAASGLWIEKGQPTKAVARVTIAGSMEEILGGIDMVADDLVWDHATKTPTFRVRELAVSGT